MQAGTQGFRLLRVCDAGEWAVGTEGYEPSPELGDVIRRLDLRRDPSLMGPLVLYVKWRIAEPSSSTLPAKTSMCKWRVLAWRGQSHPLPHLEGELQGPNVPQDLARPGVRVQHSCSNGLHWQRLQVGLSLLWRCLSRWSWDPGHGSWACGEGEKDVTTQTMRRTNFTGIAGILDCGIWPARIAAGTRPWRMV